jgi:hypothetical protein
VLLVNRRAEGAQFLPYRLILCARLDHPVIVIVMID